MENQSEDAFHFVGLKYIEFVTLFYAKSVDHLLKSLVKFVCFDKSYMMPSAPASPKRTDEAQLMSKSDISFFYCNARSLIPKLNTLQNYISLYHPSIIAITESWLNSSIPSSFFCSASYEVYRCDRLTGRGGGVLLFVRGDHISFPVSLDDCDLDSTKINAIACRVSLKDPNKSVGVLCMYRAPDCNVDDNQVTMKLIATFLSKNFDHNVIVGDFNFPEIDWPHSASSNQGYLFLSFCQENFLKQCITEPTRRVSANTLDLVLTTPGTCVRDISVNEEFASSDHAIIQFSLDLHPLNSKRKIIKRNFKNTDWKTFQGLLWDIPDWHDVLGTKVIDNIWSHFINHLKECLDRVAPFQLTSTRNLASSSRVRTALRHKRRCMKSLTSIPNTYNHLIYIRASLIAEARIKEDLLIRENYIINNPNPKIFWSYVNKRLKNENRIAFIEKDQRKITDPIEISNSFNNYFSSNFNSNCARLSDTVCNDNCNHPLSSFHVSLNDVANIIRKLPNKRSLDPDGLSYFIIKQGGTPMILHLLRIFELSFELGIVPSPWKVAIVTPIHKKGPKGTVENYRPISVTSCCSRILEKIVKNNLTQYLMKNNLIRKSQHGFLPGCSTDTILTVFYDKVTSYLDLNHAVDAVFFDFRKAFDTVPHHILISKVKSCGIDHLAFDWLSSFLYNRYQQVRITDVMSDSLGVGSGVIQGSVLGPILFNIFINDVDDVVKHGHILKYADDIRIFISSPKNDADDLKMKMQHDIDSICRWATDSGMSFNVNKCFSVSFGSSFSQRTYSIDNICIPRNSEYKDLGIIVNSALNFRSHINITVSRAFSKLGLIKKLFVKRDTTSILKLYNAFVLPSIEYASIVWSPHSASHISNLERVQKSMCRLIPRIHNMSYDDQIKSLGIFSLRVRRIRYQLTFMYKMFNGLINVNFDEMFVRRHTNRTRGHDVHLRTQFAKLNCRLHFFSISAIHEWNKLPSDIIQSSSLAIFKSKLDAYLRFSYAND